MQFLPTVSTIFSPDPKAREMTRQGGRVMRAHVPAALTPNVFLLLLTYRLRRLSEIAPEKSPTP